VDFEVYPGEVNALIGENGAGKSTLMKILSGVYKMDSGAIYFDGKPVQIDSPKDAERLGIGTVYQELSLVPELSVAENLFLGSSLATNKAGLINWKRLHKEAHDCLKTLVDLDIDTRIKVKELGIAQQQMVEIARVASQNIRVLILDEPTAVLTNREVEKLFEIVENLKAKGIAIIYISHRLEELFRISNRLTVLRDGELVGYQPIEEVTPDGLIRMMVGRSITQQFPRQDFSAIPKEERLRAEHLNRGECVRDVSFVARSGEIVGFAGLIGAGRTETARLVFGADKLESGELYVHGKSVKIADTKAAIKNKIALLPEDRKGQGLVLSHSVKQNVTIVNLRSLCEKAGLINKKKEREVVSGYVEKLRVAVRDTESAVSQLSGGNQQKVVIAKWMFAGADIVIFDEPTRGIDVGAKVEVYNVMNELVREGKAVIMISSELMELIGMCDRIYTMCEGRITSEVENRKDEPVTEDTLLKAMMG
jgi:ribose transport system ATP-binding protein